MARRDTYRVYRQNGVVKDENAQCRGKNKYSLKQARTAANEAHRRGKIREVRIYECAYCNSWHIARNQPLNKRHRD